MVLCVKGAYSHEHYDGGLPQFRSSNSQLRLRVWCKDNAGTRGHVEFVMRILQSRFRLTVLYRSPKKSSNV